jgi:receptor-type tyrosine-protein phosphatase V
MQAGSAVVNLAWVSGPMGQGTCHAQLSEAGHPTWVQPLVLGQAHLMLRDLTPGHNLSLSVLCQAGPLQASTHPVVLPIGMSVGGREEVLRATCTLQVDVAPTPSLDYHLG